MGSNSSSSRDVWDRRKFALGIVVCAIFGWLAFVRGARVPLLSLVDLGFHELGHLLTYVFPAVVTAAMGSITQVAVPLGLAAYFLFFRRDPLGGALCMAWAATSAQNASVYIADAPFELLPLLGNGLHDWAFVLGPEHLNMLDRAGLIAASVKGFGAVLLFAAFAVCAWNLVLTGGPPVGHGPTPWPTVDDPAESWRDPVGAPPR